MAFLVTSQSGLSTSSDFPYSLLYLLLRGLSCFDQVGMGHEGDYDFHSGDIISTLESLLNTFRDSKSTLETDDKNAESAYDLAKQAKEDQVRIVCMFSRQLFSGRLPDLQFIQHCWDDWFNLLRLYVVARLKVRVAWSSYGADINTGFQ